MDVHGYLDSHSMATLFKMLRANDLIWSNVINNYLLGKEPPAFDLLYWNNDGTRMTRDAHMFFLRNICSGERILPSPTRSSMKGVPIDLQQIRPGRLCGWYAAGSYRSMESGMAYYAAC